MIFPKIDVQKNRFLSCTCKGARYTFGCMERSYYPESIGADWWPTANDRYLSISGGLTVGYDTTYNYRCTCAVIVGGDTVGFTTKYVKYANQCTSTQAGATCSTTPNMQISVRTVHLDHPSTVLRPSSGMVPAWSSGNYPGLNHLRQIKVNNQYYKPQYPGDTNVPQGANHEQVNNSANTKMMMNDLLNGKIDIWFETKKVN